MTDDFSYIDLNALRNGPLSSDQDARAAFESSTGVKILVLPYANIADKWTPDNHFRQLHGLVSNLTENPPQPDGWEPKAGTYLRFTDCDRTKIYQLCEALVRPRNISGDCLVFLHGPVFRRLHNLEEFSAFADPSFLLRDDGALRRDTGEWKDSIDESDAWLGAGWFIRTQRDQCPDPSRQCHDQCQDFSGQCYERLGQRIDAKCKALCERHLLAGINDPAGRPSAADIEIKRRQIALLLTAYLPRFTQNPDHDHPVWQPYGADAKTGRRPLRGPVPWNGWRDQRLVPLEQDLLFEGWLTPIADAHGNWTLQPASLTLLFWAARVMDLPYTEDPQKFIKHHKWQGWFGDRYDWPPKQPPTGADRLIRDEQTDHG